MSDTVAYVLVFICGMGAGAAWTMLLALRWIRAILAEMYEDE